MHTRTLILALALSVGAVAGEPSSGAVQALMLKLMQETQIIMVELSGPASEFRADSDPNTLEIVQMKRKEDGPSRVSDDGEVIFLYKASDREQQNLITKAFQTRARRRLGGD